MLTKFNIHHNRQKKSNKIKGSYVVKIFIEINTIVGSLAQNCDFHHKKVNMTII